MQDFSLTVTRQLCNALETSDPKLPRRRVITNDTKLEEAYKLLVTLIELEIKLLEFELEQRRQAEREAEDYSTSP